MAKKFDSMFYYELTEYRDEIEWQLDNADVWFMDVQLSDRRVMLSIVNAEIARRQDRSNFEVECELYDSRVIKLYRP